MYFRRRKVENNFQNAYYVRQIIFDPNIFAQPSYRTNKQANKKIINEDWGFQLGAGLLQFLQEISLWGGGGEARDGQSLLQRPRDSCQLCWHLQGEKSMERQAWRVSVDMSAAMWGMRHTHTHMLLGQTGAWVSPPWIGMQEEATTREEGRRREALAAPMTTPWQPGSGVCRDLLITYRLDMSMNASNAAII